MGDLKHEYKRDSKGDLIANEERSGTAKDWFRTSPSGDC